ncbi:MAG: biopolymer transporter ExbD [Gammaproteobacteria bacterium]|nr:biopolymer transporter ExbD [Gammaproteobacteria bacterium]
MKNTRRLKRMARAKKHKAGGLNLTSLMDVFTILVFFLLVNQSATEVIEPPDEIVLPDSVVESKPRQTVIMMVSAEQVLVQGAPVVATSDVLASQSEFIEPLRARLTELKDSAIGINTQAIAESKEVTILADKEIPFKVLKKLMATCTGAGYTKISLAVNQKAHQG